MKKFLVILLGLSLALSANASAIPQLKAFVAESATLSAHFHQTVIAKGKHEQARGTLYIARPGRFRWSYFKPYEQLIVGDGLRLWIYDKELAQVTCHPLDNTLGSSPAALLAGSNAIERDYTLTEAGVQEDIAWLTASPKKSENTFKSIRIGLKNNILVEMELIDMFNNMTRLRFTDLKKNPTLIDALFVFTPPPGVDVLKAQ